MGLESDWFRRHPHPRQRLVHPPLGVLVLQALESETRYRLVESIPYEGTSQARELGAYLMLTAGHEAYRGLIVDPAARIVRVTVVLRYSDRLAFHDLEDAPDP